MKSIAPMFFAPGDLGAAERRRELELLTAWRNRDGYENLFAQKISIAPIVALLAHEEGQIIGREITDRRTVCDLLIRSASFPSLKFQPIEHLGVFPVLCCMRGALLLALGCPCIRASSITLGRRGRTVFDGRGNN